MEGADIREGSADGNANKVAFVGAGSLTFARGLVGYTPVCPLLEDAAPVLTATDAERLGCTQKPAERATQVRGCPAKVEPGMGCAEALGGAGGGHGAESGWPSVREPSHAVNGTCLKISGSGGSLPDGKCFDSLVFGSGIRFRGGSVHSHCARFYSSIMNRRIGTQKSRRLPRLSGLMVRRRPTDSWISFIRVLLSVV